MVNLLKYIYIFFPQITKYDSIVQLQWIMYKMYSTFPNWKHKKQKTHLMHILYHFIEVELKNLWIIL